MVFSANGFKTKKTIQLRCLSVILAAIDRMHNSEAIKF
jgi:hypothetical protein